ncbi:hypothetical protein NliqN6_3870 [Naganishia liquefaciens]|uniref:ornithine carbamoyltransferase n=1 Tax=Naganishia liquefaciens TaxID=104408 RepID=A0A8H3TV45_9TREE|nr:hypothetical protein NliqN6_3870 [Naganishia liquefaciens]
MQRSITLIGAATRHANVARSIRPLIASRGIAVDNLPTAPGDYIPYDKGQPVKREDRSLDKDTGDDGSSPVSASASSLSNRGRGSQRGERSSSEGFTQSRAVKAKLAGKKPPHLLSLADLSTDEIAGLLRTAMKFKHLYKQGGAATIKRSLASQAVALLFSKRSTRTRVASETSTALLGGHAMFLGKDDIQLGVNESLEDSAKVIGSMVDGIMARVGAHAEVEALVEHSPVPVINALSDLYHPTQILADLLTMYEMYDTTHTLKNTTVAKHRPQDALTAAVGRIDPLAPLKGKKVVWVGDTNNVLHDMLVSYPRLGMTIAVASPKGYDKVDERVWAAVQNGGHADKVILTNSPQEALKDADIVVTDTWISMGQEEEKAARLAAFEGYQVTEKLCAEAGAKPDWKFMHCLPRKQEEVNDEVFYGKRSVVFPEAENRKWTIMACFDHLIGQWKV